jgi:hypothetical protein
VNFQILTVTAAEHSSCMLQLVKTGSSMVPTWQHALQHCTRCSGTCTELASRCLHAMQQCRTLFHLCSVFKAVQSNCYQAVCVASLQHSSLALACDWASHSMLGGACIVK